MHYCVKTKTNSHFASKPFEKSIWINRPFSVNLMNMCLIDIRNGKMVWKHGSYCWYFCLNLKYLGWPYRAYIKTAKNSDFCEELLSENDFEAALATLWPWCQRFSGSSEDCCRWKRASKIVLLCYNLLNSQNIPINNSERLVTRTSLT